VLTNKMPFARFQVLMHALVPNKQPLPMTHKTDVAAFRMQLMRLASAVPMQDNVLAPEDDAERQARQAAT